MSLVNIVPSLKILYIKDSQLKLITCVISFSWLDPDLKFYSSGRNNLALGLRISTINT